MQRQRLFTRMRQPLFFLKLAMLLSTLLCASGALADVSSAPTSTSTANNSNIISSPVASTNLNSDLTPTAKTSRDYFILQPYKPLYAVAAYDWTLGRGNTSVQPWEMQFQISFKIQIMPIPWTSGKLAFGYTQVSFWQVFNGTHSSPFRETNYAPELMASFDYEPDVFGLKKISTKYSVIHQSNGMGGQDSRSWNRVYGEIDFNWNRVTVGVKPWYRIPERQKSSPEDARGDDNPDITRYMGYGELSAEYRADWWSLQLTGRNNFRTSPNYGSVQLDLTIPLTYFNAKDAKLYVQFFDGYGLSLIDYNRYSRRVGFGILIEKLPQLW
jgi:phospholipase A1